MFIRINPYLCHLLTRYQSTIFPNHKSCVRKKGVPHGIRFFDMKRCGLSAIRYGTYGDKVMGIVKADDYRWTLPIPAGEYRYNTSVEQNDGWPKLSV